MKITSIQTSNFLGARAVDVTLTKPIALFAGKNYAGKSSMQEAVRMALTGESVRVGLKKDYAQLITEGQDTGYAEVRGTDNGDDFGASIVLPSGKGQHLDLPALPFVLDAQRFARMAPNERRSFLFGLMNIKMGGKDVEERMKARGCDDEKASSIAPLLRAGFDAAMKEAQSRAREDKASWRTVTGGETYGEKKAASFKMPKSEVDQASLDQAQRALEAIEKEIEIASQNLGVMQARIRQAESQREKVAKLREQAAMFARVKDKLQRDEKDLKEWEQKVADAKAKAEGAPIVAHHECPECGAALLMNKGGRLELYTPPEHAPDADARQKLPEYEKALSVLQNAVANGQRDLAQCEAAAQAIAGIEDEHEGAPADQEHLDELRKKIDELKHAKGNHASAIRMLEEAQRKASEADAVTAKAAALHQSVQAWEKIADALSPDGIPGEMLAEALMPINERLAYSAHEAMWMRINISKDMTIAAGEEGAQLRDYALLSESEKWRADAMIAEAVSHLSGMKLLVLDRFDVLDLNGREDLMIWLDTLAQAGDIETALIFGTLKALPAQLPDTAKGFWIENGVCGKGTHEETVRQAA